MLLARPTKTRAVVAAASFALACACGRRDPVRAPATAAASSRPPAPAPKALSATPGPGGTELPRAAHEPDELDGLAELPAVQKNARQALAAARTTRDLTLVDATPLPSIPGAVLSYTLGPAGDGALRGFFLIGPEPGVVEDIAPSGQCGNLVENGSYEWDLRGQGSRFVVFTELEGGAHCSTGSERAYEYVGGRWTSDGAPEHPSHLADANADGKPDFPVTLFKLEMGACQWVACGASSWIVGVEGFETWNGNAFSNEPTAFREAYEGLLASLASAGENGEDANCAREAVRAAVSTYVIERLLGRLETTALRDADRLMKGKSTRACAAWMTEGKEPVLTWQEARREMRKYGTKKARKP